jgi:predicted RNase H-like HicB family nuclease
MRQYIALIHKDADSDFGVSFPDLPGCVTAGVDLDDARRMAEEALALHLAGMAEDDEPIPETSSLETVMAERENRDAVAMLVKAPPATAKAVRVNMTIPEDELEQIDKFAAEHGYTRSGFLVHAAKEELFRLAWSKLDDELNAKVDAARRANADRSVIGALDRARNGMHGELLRARTVQAIDAAKAKSDALQKAIEAGLTGEALKTIEKAIYGGLTGDALQDAIEARARKPFPAA